MTSHRLSLTLILVAVAGAGIIVGYALAGFDDGSPLQSQAPDNAPILEAIATSVAPPEPTMSPTPTFLESLPVCDQATPGTVCAPVLTTFRPCAPQDYYYPRAFVVPCVKP